MSNGQPIDCSIFVYVRNLHNKKGLKILMGKSKSQEDMYNSISSLWVCNMLPKQ